MVSVLTAEAGPFMTEVLSTHLFYAEAIHADSSSFGGTCNMSLDQSYPFPQVFLVNGGASSPSSDQPPALVPCWPFPPAQQRVRGREKSRGCMGISHSLAMIVLLLFLLVFAALGFEAYQIYQMQTEMKQIRQVSNDRV